jgi:predicted Kef-type K+ transport protein
MTMTKEEIISIIVSSVLAGIFAPPMGKKLVDWLNKKAEQRKQKKQNRNQGQDTHNRK